MEKNPTRLLNIHFVFILFILSGLFLFQGKALGQSAVSDFLPYGGNVEKETAFAFAKAKAQENLVSSLASQNQHFLFVAELTQSQLETLIFLEAEIDYEEISPENSQELQIQAKAILKNSNTLLSNIKDHLASPKALMRKENLWAEHKKITAIGENILEEAAWIRKSVGIGFDKGYSETLTKLLTDFYLLTIFQAELSTYKGLWQNLPEIQSVMEDAYSKSPDMEFIQTALAEIYLQSDRPQAALEFIDKIPVNSAQAFTLYIRALIQIRLHHYSLAEQDIVHGMAKITQKDFLYPDFLIARGLLAQLNNNIPAMCQDYKEACLYYLCEPYYFNGLSSCQEE